MVLELEIRRFDLETALAFARTDLTSEVVDLLGLLDVSALVSAFVLATGVSAALFGIARRYRVTSSCLPTSSPFLQQLPASASVVVFSLGPWPRDQILTSRGSVSATDTPRRWSLLQVSSAFEAPWAWGCVHLLISCLLDVAST